MKFHLGEASCPTRAAPSRHTQRPQQNSAPAGQWTSSHHDSEPPLTNEPRAERHNPQTTQHGGRTASPAQPEDKGSSTAWRPKHPLPWHPPSTPAVPWEAAAGTSRNAIAEPLCMVLPRLGGGSATSRWPWRSDPRVSTAKARIRPLASRDTARRRADPAPNRRRQARLPDASNWRQTG